MEIQELLQQPTTDTLTIIEGGANIIQHPLVGDTVTVAYTGPQLQVKKTQFAFSNVPIDPGLAQADPKTDTLTIAGGTNISK